MSRILVLDDDRARHSAFARNLKGHDVVHVMTAHGAVTTVNACPRFDVFFLDHDLSDFQARGYGEQEVTGADFARWMAEKMDRAKVPGVVWIHSWNPDGAKTMAAWLRDLPCDVVREPWTIHTGSNIR